MFFNQNGSLKEIVCNKTGNTKIFIFNNFDNMGHKRIPVSQHGTF